MMRPHYGLPLSLKRVVRPTRSGAREIQTPCRAYIMLHDIVRAALARRFDPALVLAEALRVASSTPPVRGAARLADVLVCPLTARS
jgi:hypothetical protein